VVSEHVARQLWVFNEKRFQEDLKRSHVSFLSTSWMKALCIFEEEIQPLEEQLSPIIGLVNLQ